MGVDGGCRWGHTYFPVGLKPQQVGDTTLALGLLRRIVVGETKGSGLFDLDSIFEGETQRGQRRS